MIVNPITGHIKGIFCIEKRAIFANMYKLFSTPRCTLVVIFMNFSLFAIVLDLGLACAEAFLMAHLKTSCPFMSEKQGLNK